MILWALLAGIPSASADTDETEPPAARAVPRLDVIFASARIGPMKRTTVLALLTIPLGSGTPADVERGRTEQRIVRGWMESRSARLDVAAARIAHAALQATNPKRRVERLLRAEELAAQAQVIAEAAP